MDSFQEILQTCPLEFRMALIDVCDTAEMCQRWFESRKIEYKAADVVEMTKLVLAREAHRTNYSE
jgi:hypothetical protein